MIKIIIKYVWINGHACIKLPAGIISFTDNVTITTSNLKKKVDFTRLQQLKERECLDDVIEELRDRFKDKKE